MTKLLSFLLFSFPFPFKYAPNVHLNSVECVYKQLISHLHLIFSTLSKKKNALQRNFNKIKINIKKSFHYTSPIGLLWLLSNQSDSGATRPARRSWVHLYLKLVSTIGRITSPHLFIPRNELKINLERRCGEAATGADPSEAETLSGLKQAACKPLRVALPRAVDSHWNAHFLHRTA